VAKLDTYHTDPRPFWIIWSRLSMGRYTLPKPDSSSKFSRPCL